ncbi:isopeptide-forming domain-containing fimbrial protein [Corynebacterium diphtheriae]|nr:isopeptide-forming domain-containing fimbrial protein [Corynebacterium diphtheriae]
MNKFSRTARSVTFAAIVGLSLGVSAPGAFAQNAPVSLIDMQKKGTLTIHKKADPSKVGTPTGETAVVEGGDLNGVGFTVYKINDITLTTNEGLAAAKNKKATSYLTPEGKADTSKVTLVGEEQNTGDKGNSQGQTVFSNLAPAAYLVVESTPKDGYNPAAPFIAFVPMTKANEESGGTEWNYNVVAYPKNYKKEKVDKNVVDIGFNAGDKIQFTVVGTPQAAASGQKREVFRIVDKLDTKLTPPTKDEIKVAFQKTEASFVADRDYEVTVQGQVVTVDFKSEGLNKLTAVTEVVVTIPATLKETITGIIPNQAVVYADNPNVENDFKEPNEPGNPEDPKNPGTPTPVTKTYLGDVTFKKVEAGTENGLDGAAFDVYGARESQKCEEAVKVSAQKLTRTGTSSEGGTVTITGLHANDVANEKTKPGPDGKFGTEDDEITSIANKYTSYCLVETKSPKGYELLAQPVEFNLTKEETLKNKAKPIGTDGKVENLKDRTPELPMTGGAGVGILAAIGAAIIGAGAWFARRNSAES